MKTSVGEQSGQHIQSELDLTNETVRNLSTSISTSRISKLKASPLVTEWVVFLLDTTTGQRQERRIRNEERLCDDLQATNLEAWT